MSINFWAFRHKKILDRVVAEFIWPGLCGDVARFLQIL